MPDERPIAPNEVLLRRLTAHPDSIQDVPGRGKRATSFSLRALPGESGASCSRFPPTSPRQLLDQLRQQGKDPSKWSVCWFTAAEATSLGLDVVPCRTADDEGHCELRIPAGSTVSKRAWSRLAERTVNRVLSYADTDSVSNPDQLSGWTSDQ